MDDAELSALLTAMDVLYQLPVAVIGMDESGVITLANRKAGELLANDGELPLLGESARDSIPQELLASIAGECGYVPERHAWQMASGHDASYWCYAMENRAGEQMYVLVVDPD